MDNGIYKQQHSSYFTGLRRQLEMFIPTMYQYLILIKVTIPQLWQYLEFKVLVFIFACISCIPFTLFLVFWTCLTCLTVFVSTTVWLLFSIVALLILFPFLIGSMGVAIGLVLVYQICVITKIYLAMIFSSVSNDENDDNSTICNGRM